MMEIISEGFDKAFEILDEFLGELIIYFSF